MKPPGGTSTGSSAVVQAAPSIELVLDVPGELARLTECGEPAREGRAPARPRWLRRPGPSDRRGAVPGRRRAEAHPPTPGCSTPPGGTRARSLRGAEAARRREAARPR